MRAGVYTRISLDKAGQSLGVQRQEKDCRALARRLGWKVVTTWTDNDMSATSGKQRPGFEALLDAVKAGEIDAVLCWHPDRLYRKLGDLTRLLDVAKDVEFRTVTAGQLDLSSPTGRMMAGILGSVSTAEVEHKAERQRAAALQKAESGAPKWRKAFGYIDRGGDVRELDPVVAPLVAKAYALVLAGGSLNDVCRLWNDAGARTITGKLWTAPQVSTFLRKPRNAGLRTYQAGRGKADAASVIGKGTWPPIVPEETFWAAQSVLDAPGRAPGRKSVRQHLLTGVMRCGKCGEDVESYLSGQWAIQRTGGAPGRPKAGEAKHHDGQKVHSIVYACKLCHGNSIRAHYVEPMIYKWVAGRLAKPDAVDLLRAELHDAAEAEALRMEANSIRARLDSLAVEFADGELSSSQLRAATARLNEKLAAVQDQLHDTERVRVFDEIPLGTPEAAKAVEKLSPDRFRSVLDVLMTVTVMPVGKGGKQFNPERVIVTWRG